MPYGGQFWKWQENIFLSDQGIGSFAEVYQVDEGFAFLSPEYLNHAHNDWIEIILTGGAPAALLAILALIAWGWQAKRVLFQPSSSRRNMLYGKLGAVIMFIVALGSVSDYPLRVPSITVLFVIAAVWMAGAFRDVALPHASRRVD